VAIHGPAGVYITHGPRDWQIIQQTDGKADLTLGGTYAPRDIPDGVRVKVVVRVVREETGEAVVPWRDARLDPDGRTWSVELKGVPAGGLYRIETMLASDEFRMDNVITRGDMVHHVGIGDIFLIAGQSNASGRGKDPIEDPPELGVHLYRNCGEWSLATHPLNESTRSVYPAHIEYHNPSHSPYLQFAKVLKRRTNMPIGLIQSAVGGRPLRCWDEAEDGELFRNMVQIARDAAGGRIRGVLWYQGCNDALEGRSEDYLARFAALVRRTREELGSPDLPFFTVQLNRCTMAAEPETDRHWGRLREAQRQASLAIPGVYVVPATDCAMYDQIHNSAAANMMLGERLARQALAVLYGRGEDGAPPDLVRAEEDEDGKVVLTFAPVVNRLHLFMLPPERAPFTLEDEAGAVPIAGLEADGARVILTPGRALSGRCVVHGVWQMNPPGPPPADWGRMPILSFYGAEVRRHKANPEEETDR
jgi:hypothetical protein